MNIFFQQVVVGWEALQAKDDDPRMRNETRECMLSLLKARKIILRTLASVGESDTASLFITLSQDIRSLVRDDIPRILCNFLTENGKNKVNSVIIPIDAVMRLREMYDSEQLVAIACLTECLSHKPYPDKICIETLRKSESIRIPSIPEQEKPVSFNRFFLRASTCGETLSILISICSVVMSQSRPDCSQKKNKKKQNKENEDALQYISQVRLLVYFHVINRRIFLSCC